MATKTADKSKATQLAEQAEQATAKMNAERNEIARVKREMHELTTSSTNSQNEMTRAAVAEYIEGGELDVPDADQLARTRSQQHEDLRKQLEFRTEAEAELKRRADMLRNEAANADWQEVEKPKHVEKLKRWAELLVEISQLSDEMREMCSDFCDKWQRFAMPENGVMPGLMSSNTLSLKQMHTNAIAALADVYAVTGWLPPKGAMSEDLRLYVARKGR